ncbi:beta-propeller fold lactonase family protein [Paenibacillus filicis]|uniref:Beta-propeller fold lactonase family protein n=1 Tax=Paenibacillus gyeongsangnamensis TaxID=3388067 RepID=A0ABT4QIB2_9BACL|nr:beta-propeller fold lactonase family protein [Paenibacillus filicis]MCZ8516441.1 beta-propeller fold lactonase family protein [Paenibacillus filicis]
MKGNEKRRKKLSPRTTIAAITCLGVLALGGVTMAADFLKPGPQANGTAYTPAGWRVTPAGSQKPAGFFPANAVLAPDGKAVLVPNIVKNENGKQSVQVMDAMDGSLIQQVEVDGTGQGVAPGLVFSHDGSHVYLATANKQSVVVFGWDSSTHKLTFQRSLKLPGGTYPQEVAVSPDDKTIYVSGQYANKLVAVDVASGQTAQATVGSYPYGVVLSEDGHTAYVSNQGENTMSVLSVDGLTMTPKNPITVGTHPNSMLIDAKKHRLFVANGDNDTVSVVETGSNTVTDTISLAPFQDAHAGTQPNNLALSPDGNTMYVTNGGNNDVAVVDVSGPSSENGNGQGDFGRIKGLIPTGWYPTGVQITPDGKRMLITSAKGLGTGPNAPADPSKPTNYPYIERQLQGFLQVVDIPSNSQLNKYTRMVWENNGFNDHGKVNGFDKEENASSTIVPRHVGDSSPIKHVIYIVKENRTYDQVFGDLGKGNGDPSLAIFGKDVTPNHHKLAEQFVTLDNFYANGEVSQNGWQWVTQASSNPYNELGTAQGYAGNGSQYDSEGYHPFIAAGSSDPAHAYLWDKLALQNIPFRNYGQFVVPSNWFKASDQVKCVQGKFCAYDPLLDANTNHDYAWYDMGVTDQHRFDVWNQEFQQYVANNNLPSMQFIDLPRDHTAGGATAKQLVADNDLALGKIVDTVSHSKYWKDTAIFVVEDDPQNGPDHVDAHRTVALAISPYTQRGIVDSHFYSQVSMLRTIELFLGVEPMSQFDAAAMPMIWSFSDKPNFASYTAVSAPSMSVTVSSPIVKPGQTVTVTGTVYNAGNAPLSGAALRLVTPNGWTAAPGQVPLNLDPGARTSMNWTVTVPASVQYGQQMFTVQADYPISEGLTGSQSVSVAVVVPDPNIAKVPQAFVANYSSNTVSAIDLSTGKLMVNIPVGQAPGTVVVSPDRTKAFVANQGSNTVSVIDAAADAVVATIPVGKIPAGLTVSPDSKTLWVTAYGDNTVQPVDIASNTAGQAISVGKGPENVAITPDGSTLYVANKNDGTVTPVNTAARTAGTPIMVGTQPFGVAITPDGKTAFVSNSGSNDVTPIDIVTGTTRPKIPAGSGPFNVAISQNGTTLYVADSGSNTVTPIDIATGTAKPALTIGSGMTGVAISPDGATVYASVSGAGQLVPISVATGQPGTPITVGSYPISVAVTAPVNNAVTTAAAQPLTQEIASNSPSVHPSLVMTPEDLVGQPDKADPQKLNEEIWRAIKGPNVPMPAPNHRVLGGNNETDDSKQGSLLW